MYKHDLINCWHGSKSSHSKAAVGKLRQTYDRAAEVTEADITPLLGLCPAATVGHAAPASLVQRCSLWLF